jgi:hypothetical protein
VVLLAIGALHAPFSHAQASSTAIPQLTPGLISTVAGEYYKSGQLFSGDGGPATSAQMWNPEGMALDSQGNLYIADSANNVIRVVNMQSTAITILGVTIQPGDIETVIGVYTSAASGFGSFSGDGGPAGQAGLALPDGLAFDAQGNLYIADTKNGRIRVVNMQSSAITAFGVSVPPGAIETIAGDLDVSTGAASNCASATDNLGDGCPATQAGLFHPTSIAFDSGGNLYIVDSREFAVRKVSSSTAIISLVAGNGTNGFSGDGGAATQAELFDPNWVQLDPSGNIYIADLGSNRVRVVNTQSTAITLYGVAIQPGNIDTVAGSGTAIVNAQSNSAGYSGDGGPANQAHLDDPSGVWLDPVGDLYIADSMNEVIRKVNAQTGFISTIAGSTVTIGAYSGDGGPSTSAQFNTPYSVLLDPAGDVFIADEDNEVIREIQANTLVLNFPDTYPGSVSQDQVVTFQNIGGAAMTLSGLSLGGADPGSFDDETSCPKSLASGDSCTFDLSFEPASSGALTASLSITESSPSASQSIVLNGTGSSTTIAQIMVSPTQLSFANQAVGTVSASQPITVTNNGTAALSPSAAEAGILTMIGPNAGNFTQTNNCGSSLAAGASCTISVFFAPQAPVNSKASLVLEGDGKNTPVFVSLSGTGTNSAGVTPPNPPLLQVIPGTISTIAGDNVRGYTGDGGAAIAAELDTVSGLSVDAAGDLYIGDTYNQVIRYVNEQNTVLSPDGITVEPTDIATIAGDGEGAGTGSGTYTGDGGPAIDAGLDEPTWTLLDSAGNLYFADYESQTIRVINSQPNAITVNGVSIPSYGIQTVAGKGPVCSTATDGLGDGCPANEAIFERPGQIAMDAGGNLYIADTCHQVVRAINMGSSTATIAGVSIAPGEIQIIAGTLLDTIGGCGAGSGTFAGDGGSALSAHLYLPMALAIDGAGNIYIGDSANWRIRAINTQATTQTILGVSIGPGDIETVAGTGTYGYSGDFGPATQAEIVGTSTPETYSLALDPAGNLYLADCLNNVIREIFASTGMIRTVAGNGYGAIQTQTVNGKIKGTYSGGYAGDGGAATSAELYGPDALVIDAFGNLDIGDAANLVVRQVTSTPAGFNFPDTQVGTTSAAQIYTFSNISTQSIAFSGITISQSFKQVASGLTDCSATTTTLPPGGICQLALAFAPSAVGYVTGTAVVTDAAGVQTIDLSGTGTAADGAVLQAITISPANSPAINQGSTQQFSATGIFSDGSTQNLTSTVVWTSSMPGVAQFGVTAGLATGVSTGTTQITATMGNIVSAPVTLTVNPASTLTSQTITVTTAAPASAADNNTFMVAATASSSLPVSIAASGACTGSGTSSATITMTAATGTCTVTYTQAGNSTYAAAPTVTSSTTATAASLTSQTITVTTAAPASAADNSTFMVAATASSSLPVSIAASGACAGSGTGSATISMTAATGTCIVTYTQAGNSTYAAAPTVTSSTTAENPVPTIAGLVPAHTPAGAAFTLAVNGTNFIPSSTVNLGGSAAATNYVSATQLTVNLAAAAVSSGGSLAVTVTNPAPGGGTSSPAMLTLDDFTLSGPSGNVTVESGVATPVTLTVTPSSDGFANAIQLAVANVPAGWTAQFLSASTVTPGNASATVALTVTAPATAPATSASANRPAARSLGHGLPSALGGLVGLMMAILFPIRRFNPRIGRLLRGKIHLVLWLAAVCALGFTLSGCGGGFGFAGQSSQQQNQQTVTLTVTASSGTLEHSTSVTFVLGSAK